MNAKKCCPKHPDANHLLTVEHIHYPDLFDKKDFWWVWNCQNMTPPFDGAPPMRCGYKQPIKKYEGGLSE